METHGSIQDGNGDRSSDENKSSGGKWNRDGDRNRDGNEDGIGEVGGEVKKRKKPHKSCRRDQALLFRARHLLCRQGVVLTCTRQRRSQSPVSVKAHRNEGVTGSEGREGANGVGGGSESGV